MRRTRSLFVSAKRMSPLRSARTSHGCAISASIAGPPSPAKSTRFGMPAIAGLRRQDRDGEENHRYFPAMSMVPSGSKSIAAASEVPSAGVSASGLPPNPFPAMTLADTGSIDLPDVPAVRSGDEQLTGVIQCQIAVRYIQQQSDSRATLTFDVRQRPGNRREHAGLTVELRTRYVVNGSVKTTSPAASITIDKTEPRRAEAAGVPSSLNPLPPP